MTRANIEIWIHAERIPLIVELEEDMSVSRLANHLHDLAVQMIRDNAEVLLDRAKIEVDFK
jgi:hypothetical protein